KAEDVSADDAHASDDAFADTSSVDGETIEARRAAGAAQLLGIAAVRVVRRVPRRALRHGVLGVAVADGDHVVAGRRGVVGAARAARRAVGARAGEDVVL